MKRAILLGIAILCVSSMAMAVSGPLSGHYGNLIIDGYAWTVGYVDCDTLAVTDTSVGLIGDLLVSAGTTMDVWGYARLGVGNMGTISVEGEMNIDGHFDYDGNPSTSGEDGVYGVLNVTGDGVLNTGQHTIWGGYAVAHPWTVTLSDNSITNIGLKPLYIGGTLGSAVVTMSGNAQLINETGLTGYYDNMLNVGWSPDLPDSGKLIVEATNTVKFRHVLVKAGGTVEYILDAAGQACVLTAELPVDVDPDAGQDAYMSFEPGSMLALDTSGVAAGLLVAGFSVDLATTDGGWSNLRWDTPGTWDATLSVDGVVMPDWGLWRLREKPGDVTTLQAYIIPEPTTMALLGLGGLLAALRRKS